MEMRQLARTIFLATMFAVGCAGGGGGDDSGGDDGGFTGDDTGGDDGGGDDGGGGGCTADVLEMPTAAACATSTQNCMEECEDDACFETCMSSDPDPEGCGTCLEDGWLACVNAAGCQPEWDAMSCCYDGCDDPDSAACETECSLEDTAYENCAVAYEETCAEQVDGVCFGN
jgi:hypothetical protein